MRILHALTVSLVHPIEGVRMRPFSRFPTWQTRWRRFGTSRRTRLRACYWSVTILSLLRMRPFSPFPTWQTRWRRTEDPSTLPGKASRWCGTTWPPPSYPPPRAPQSRRALSRRPSCRAPSRPRDTWLGPVSEKKEEFRLSDPHSFPLLDPDLSFFIFVFYLLNYLTLRKWKMVAETCFSVDT